MITVEEGQESRIDWIGTYIRREHGRHKLSVLDDLLIQVASSFVDEPLLDQKLEPRYGLLCSINVHFRHVQIVNEDH